MKYKNWPIEYIFIIWEICICELREPVDDEFLSLDNFEGERFPSKLGFGEATQVFHGYLMEFYLQV